MVSVGSEAARALGRILGAPALLEVLPLLVVLSVPRLLLVLLRSPPSELAINLPLLALFECSFAMLCAGTAQRLLERRWTALLLRALLPGLQVLGVADAIYTTLIGAPLKLRLVVYFLVNMQSEYMQHILALYVGVGIPLLLAILLGTLGFLNHLAVRALAGCAARRASHPPAKNAPVARLALRASRLLPAAVVVAIATVYGVRLAPTGPAAVRLAAAGNILTRGLGEVAQLARGPATAGDVGAEWPALEVVGRPRKRNVLVVGLETARADAFGPWGEPAVAAGAPRRWGEGSRTPRLDALAARGRVVRTAYTPVPNTVKAIVSLFCGLATEVSMAWSEFEALDLDANCLPAMLRRLGYATAVFTSGALKDHVIGPADRAAMGFETTVGYEELVADAAAATAFEEVSYLGLEDDALLPATAAWLAARKAAGRPFCMGVFTVTTHAPYATPSRFQPAGRPPPGARPAASERAYGDAVEYADRFVGKLYAQLEAAGLAEETLFVVAGDHGEMFGEHGQWQHGAAVHEEALHIPLLLVGPDTGAAGAPIEGLRSLMDVAPTALQWLGLSTRGGPPLLRPGRSLLEPTGHNQLCSYSFFDDELLALHLAPERPAPKDARFRYGGRLKLIVDARSGATQAYDLAADPAELVDIAGSMHRGTLDGGVAALGEWKAGTNAAVARSRVTMAAARAAAAAAAATVLVSGSGGVADGVYRPAPGHGGLKKSPFACRSCYELARADGEAGGSLAIFGCDYGRAYAGGGGGAPIWAIALRFESFDAVLFEADGPGAGPGECGAVPTAGWRPVGEARFRFGDLDEGSRTDFAALRGWGDTDSSRHLAAVIRKHVGASLGLAMEAIVITAVTLRWNGDDRPRFTRYSVGMAFRLPKGRAPAAAGLQVAMQLPPLPPSPQPGGELWWAAVPAVAVVAAVGARLCWDRAPRHEAFDIMLNMVR
jgi:arylsulfatase A-like enzyme